MKFINSKNNLKGHYAWANLTLGFMSIGLLASFPLRSTFGGGLAFSIFSAGTIAGLADWFAVSAFFRRPLGIPPGRILRTEIIARNRERIFQALTDITATLLNKETLLAELNRYNAAKTLVDYLSEPQVLHELNSLVRTLLDDFDTRLLLQDMAILSQQLFKKPEVARLTAESLKTILRQSRKQNFDIRAISHLARYLQELSVRPEVFRTLEHMIAKAYQTYEQDHTTRKWLDILLPSPTELAKEIQNEIVTFLAGPKPVMLVRSWLETSQEDPSVFLAFWTNISQKGQVRELLEQSDLNNMFRHGLYKVLDSAATTLLHSFQEQPDRLKALDQLLKSIFSQVIETHHATLTKIIRSKLDALTDQDLVQLIEAKAGNDLQMVRINGSLIGGLAGMFIYLLTKLF